MPRTSKKVSKITDKDKEFRCVVSYPKSKHKIYETIYPPMMFYLTDSTGKIISESNCPIDFDEIIFGKNFRKKFEKMLDNEEQM